MKQLTLFLIVLLGLSMGGCMDSSTPELSPTASVQTPETATPELSPTAGVRTLDTATPTPSPTGDLGILETAYQNSDQSLLLDFFRDWQARIPPQSDSELAGQPPEVIAAYEVFTAFYDPFLDREIKHSHWRPDYYEGIEFIIVQNSISFRIINGNETMVDIKRIKDFRPELDFGEIGIVYLTDEYRQLLSTFLDTDGSCQRYGDSNDRSRFLRQLVKVICKHWGGGWMIATHPVVGPIEFNPELTQATVNFVLENELCEAVSSKMDGHWEMIDIRFIAVE